MFPNNILDNKLRQEEPYPDQGVLVQKADVFTYQMEQKIEA